MVRKAGQAQQRSLRPSLARPAPRYLSSKANTWGVEMPFQTHRIWRDTSLATIDCSLKRYHVISDSLVLHRNKTRVRSNFPCIKGEYFSPKKGNLNFLYTWVEYFWELPWTNKDWLRHCRVGGPTTIFLVTVSCLFSRTRTSSSFT